MQLSLRAEFRFSVPLLTKRNLKENPVPLLSTCLHNIKQYTGLLSTTVGPALKC